MVTTAVFATVHPSASNTTDDAPPHRWLDSDNDPATSATATETRAAPAGYSFDYGAVAASASAEIAGTTLVLLTIDRLGRVPSQAFAYAAGGASVFALCWMDSSSSSEQASRTSLVLAAFFARLCFMGATCTTWVSTAELFPTRLRTTGHASCNAVGRLGGAASPLLLVGFLSAAADGGSPASSSSIRVAGIALLAVSLTTAWSTWQLPETAGRAMGRRGSALPVDTVEEDGVFRSDSHRARAADGIS
jgi:hypothetical protein